MGTALADVCKAQLSGDSLFVMQQFFPRSLAQIFPFFADARNLEKITPPLLRFKIVAMSTPQIQQGTVIDYRLRLRGWPIGWKTLIQEWSPPLGFVDNQERGPYRKWHHTHSFQVLGDGTLMTDRVLYRVPLGAAGQLALGPWVRSDIEKIFAYRRKAVLEILT
jgi:ligand-binding SRPBCC domain-containing protein